MSENATATTAVVEMLSVNGALQNFQQQRLKSFFIEEKKLKILEKLLGSIESKIIKKSGS